ncbi:hypothetical protein DWB78_13325 [Halopelagius longus]|uniref:Uncharacterized protein n=1 Tax=Halopelagius longus TaxID=1236180 RepID=A0A1H0YQH6_9EURY|nr:hypothetical protein DWB78_13325 [Halopelagius longus]SDQ17399.1 hypothetical protein SAMN05216278_0781 [Halopelagius longus]
MAGCLNGTPTDSSGSTPTEDSTTAGTTPTETPLPDSVVASGLDFEASVLSQSSADSPARFEATLRNAGRHALTLDFGPTLMFSGGGGVANTSGRGDALRIVPDGEVGLVETPSEPNESGCWRAEGVTAVQSILVRKTLEPGDTFSETYSMYTAPDAPTCLPDGEDAIRDAVGTHDGHVVTTLSFSVADGAVSVSGSVVPILDAPRESSRSPEGSSGEVA